MRRFITELRQTVHFCLLAILLTVVVCSLLLQTVNPAPRSRLDNVTLDKVNVLVLGNSQLLGLLADDDRILNLSLAGSDYTIQNQILRHAGPRLKNLRFVLLGFDNIPLRTPAIDRMNGDYRSLERVGIPWYAIPEITLYEKTGHLLLYNRWLRPLIAGQKFDAGLILSWLRADRDPEPAPQNTSGASYAGPDVVREGFYLAPTQGSRKIKDYLNALEHNNNLASNLTALEQMSDYCIDSKIRLILIRPPTTPEFIAGRSQQWQEELDRVLFSLQSRQAGTPLPFLDAEQMDAYGLEYFDDPNHLSSEGKRRYSESLMSTLESMLQD